MQSNKLELFDNYHILAAESDSVFYEVDALYAHLDNVSDRNHLARVLDVFVTHFGDVEQTVIVYADVYKCAEVYYVSYSTLQKHIGLEVLYVKDVSA